MSSMVEIAGYAYDAGLRSPASLAKAVAIAWAESGGNPTAKGDQLLANSEWGPSVGLWQIRSLKAEKGKGTTRDEDALVNPAHNARSMMTISGGGTNWGPWSVSSPGDPVGFARYTAALIPAASAVSRALATKGAGQIADQATDAVDGPIDAVREVAATISETVQTPVRMANWLTEAGTWRRISLFWIGGSLVVAGLIVLARPVVTAAVKSDVGQLAKKAVVRK